MDREGDVHQQLQEEDMRPRKRRYPCHAGACVQSQDAASPPVPKWQTPPYQALAGAGLRQE
jgi:hypothetical protein